MTLRYISFLLLLLTAASCKDDIDIKDFVQPAKLTIYAMPGTEDTTYIRISAGIPITDGNSSKEIPLISDAQVTYTVDDKPQHVDNLGRGLYRVVCRKEPGSRISIQASHPDYPTATAHTQIPEAVPVKILNTAQVSIYDDNSATMLSYDQIQASFKDTPGRHDYYAVQVIAQYFKGSAAVYKDREQAYFNNYSSFNTYSRKDYDSIRVVITDTLTQIVPINTAHEPALGTMTDIDDFFGYGNYFAWNFNIFDDALFDGQEHTLRLNVRNGLYSIPFSPLSYQYQVVLYRLSPEFFRYVHAINLQDNNDLSSMGLAQINMSESNIENGYGILGAWNSHASDMFRPAFIPSILFTKNYEER